MAEDSDKYHEHKLPSGFSVTLQNAPNGGYHVDMWNKNNEHHWNRWYSTYAKAKAEYDKWTE